MTDLFSAAKGTEHHPSCGSIKVQDSRDRLDVISMRFAHIEVLVKVLTLMTYERVLARPSHLKDRKLGRGSLFAP